MKLGSCGQVCDSSPARADSTQFLTCIDTLSRRVIMAKRQVIASVWVLVNYTDVHELDSRAYWMISTWEVIQPQMFILRSIYAIHKRFEDKIAHLRRTTASEEGAYILFGRLFLWYVLVVLSELEVFYCELHPRNICWKILSVVQAVLQN